MVSNTGAVYPDDCDCFKVQIDTWLSMTDCKTRIEQINNDLSHFKSIDFNSVRDKMIKFFSSNIHSMSICQYVVKNNSVREYIFFFFILINNISETFYVVNIIFVLMFFRYFENVMENIQVLKCSWIIYYCH